MNNKLVQRLLARTNRDETTGCWVCTTGLSGNGYGQISVSNKMTTMHRASWLAHFGPIPAGELVLHRCNNKQCCNPEHLYLGSKSDNFRDAVTDGVAALKLNDLQVRLAVRLRKLGWPLREIAELYNVSISCVSRACRRDTYGWVRGQIWVGYNRRR